VRSFYLIAYDLHQIRVTVLNLINLFHFLHCALASYADMQMSFRILDSEFTQFELILREDETLFRMGFVNGNTASDENKLFFLKL